MKNLRPLNHYFALTAVVSLSLAASLVFAAPKLSKVAPKKPVLSVSKGEAPTVPTQPVSSPASLSPRVTVMVEFSNSPAASVYATAYQAAQAQADAKRQSALQHPNTKTSKALLKTPVSATTVSVAASAVKQANAAATKNDQVQKAVLPSLTGNIGAQVLYRTQRAYNGIAMIVAPEKISAIATLPGVKAVHPMHPKFLTTTFEDIDFLGGRAFWTKSPGIHGENIKVADIDTGLDYIHTNFGGAGTPAAYSNADMVSAHHTTAPNAYFPNPKVPGGYDFAGDAYSATAAGNAPSDIPHPDPDPFDCGGHGTGTASLIAGYGVTTAGFTYSGNYDNTTDMNGLILPPGFAPEAKLYPLRVFGCSGSTNLVTEAIEWAMTSGTGDFNNKVDVINMSLGANEGFADDPDDVAAANAASVGILVNSAAGNAGDSYYINSSPASATGTLSVAATYNNQNGYIANALITGNQPASFAGQQGPSIYTTTSPTNQTVTGDVVYAINPAGPTGDTHDGSHPLTNAAQCAGKIVVVDRVSGQGANASVNCQNAGAIGIIDIANQAQQNGQPFLLSTSPALTIPMVVCPTAYGAALISAAQFDPTDGHSTSSPACNVTIAPFTQEVVLPANPPGSPAGAGSTDTLPSYSSRGPRMPDSFIKPDLSAPAEVTAVAVVGSGNGYENFNGTSSATPHVSGFMALIKQAHPTWSVQEMQALACNTATHDLYTTEPGASPSPTPSVQVGVGRIGAGRIDLANASNANVVAFNGSDPGEVGVSFGDVEVPVDGSVALTKNITVENKGASNVSYTVSIVYNPPLTGTSYSVANSTVPVNAGASATIPLTFNATGNLMKHDHDPSVSETQAAPYPRQWLSESAGYAVLTPNDGSPVLRVALYAAPKPVSSMHATSNSAVPSTPDNGSFTLNLSGSAINEGDPSNGHNIVSLVKPFELQYQSEFVGQSNQPSDRNQLKFVGVTSDYVATAPFGFAPFSTISFGVDRFGNVPIPDFSASDTEIFIDTNADDVGVQFVPDHVIYLGNIGNDSSINAAGYENTFFTIIVDLSNGSQTADQFTDLLPSKSTVVGPGADTNAYNNSAVVMPVYATDVGLVGGDGNGPTQFQYQVVTFDRSGQEHDQSNVLFFDVANPGFDTTNPNGDNATVVPAQGPAYFEPFYYQDIGTNSVPIAYNGANFQNNGSLGVLLLHMHNANAGRSDVVNFLAPIITGFSPTSAHVGDFITISGANFGPGTQVVFTPNVIATTVNVITPNTMSVRVPAGAQSGPIRVQNAAGSSVKGGFTVLP